jgi:hypothetical protein
VCLCLSVSASPCSCRSRSLFVSNLPVGNQTAETEAAAIKKRLFKDLQADKKKLIGVSLDNASTNMGDKGGIHVLLEREVKHSLSKSGCDEHVMNMTTTDGVGEVLGQGDMTTRNLYQTLFKLGHRGVEHEQLSAYFEVFKAQHSGVWGDYAIEQPPMPLLLRWWKMSRCLRYLLEHYEFLLAFSRWAQGWLRDGLSRKMWGELAVLLRIPLIHAQAVWLEEFDNLYYSQESWWSCQPGSISKQVGFRSHELPARCLERLCFLLHAQRHTKSTFEKTAAYLETVDSADEPLPEHMSAEDGSSSNSSTTESLRRRVWREIRQALALALESTKKHCGYWVRSPEVVLGIFDPAARGIWSRAVLRAVGWEGESSSDDETMLELAELWGKRQGKTAAVLVPPQLTCAPLLLSLAADGEQQEADLVEVLATMMRPHEESELWLKFKVSQALSRASLRRMAEGDFDLEECVRERERWRERERDGE